MQLSSFNYQPDTGWSVNSFPELDSENTLVILFADSSLQGNDELLTSLYDAYPLAQFCGCSTSGEIYDTQIMDDAISVAVLKFERSQIKLISEPVDTPHDSYKTACKVAEQLVHDDLKAVFLLSDGLCVNGTELVKGFNEHLSENIIITGGLAGDNDRFERTWVLSNRQLLSRQIVAVGFYGDQICIGHGSQGGWDQFGPERRVTRSEGNIVYEIDYLPALELYKKYLGEKADDLPASGLLFPLSVRMHSEDDTRVVRTLLAVDEEAQSLTFAGDIPTGSLAQLMMANFDRLIDGAYDAAEAVQSLPEQADKLVIAISCVGRRLVLKQRTEEEIEATLETLPENTQQIGFYSYGEISPYAKGNCDLHNQTMTLTVITEYS